MGKELIDYLKSATITGNISLTAAVLAGICGDSLHYSLQFAYPEYHRGEVALGIIATSLCALCAISSAVPAVFYFYRYIKNSSTKKK